MGNIQIEKVAMVTGANTGIGREVARQLALSGDYKRIYLACRNHAKAEKAAAELQASTGKTIFQILPMNLSDLKSVREGIASLAEPIDDLVMNAGGSGGKAPFALTSDGVSEIIASNVLGHAALLDGLITRKLLKHSAVFAGSEAARGVPKLQMKRPSLSTSSRQEFVSLCNGNYFRDHKTDPASAYGLVKYLGALWISATARQFPELKLLSVSPGNTRGTEIARDFPVPLRFLMKYLLMPVILPLRGLVHEVDEAAKRLIRGLNDGNLISGKFYGSQADALVGPLVDQSEIFPDLSNASYQDQALEALRSFL